MPYQHLCWHFAGRRTSQFTSFEKTTLLMSRLCLLLKTVDVDYLIDAAVFVAAVDCYAATLIFSPYGEAAASDGHFCCYHCCLQ